VRIARELVDEIVAHARDEAPNECCGMVAADGDRAMHVYRAINTRASPLAYEIDGQQIIDVVNEIEDSGWRLGAIYHSHTRSDPYPSQTDINLAFWPDTDQEAWPGTLYVIVGLASGQPELRAYRIPARGRVEEVALDIEG
jgi:[CysO sulfur-carrier protein]-S-L-cysteine hydrolase